MSLFGDYVRNANSLAQSRLSTAEQLAETRGSIYSANALQDESIMMAGDQEHQLNMLDKFAEKYGLKTGGLGILSKLQKGTRYLANVSEKYDKLRSAATKGTEQLNEPIQMREISPEDFESGGDVSSAARDVGTNVNRSGFTRVVDNPAFEDPFVDAGLPEGAGGAVGGVAGKGTLGVDPRGDISGLGRSQAPLTEERAQQFTQDVAPVTQESDPVLDAFNSHIDSRFDELRSKLQADPDLKVKIAGEEGKTNIGGGFAKGQHADYARRTGRPDIGDDVRGKISDRADQLADEFPNRVSFGKVGGDIPENEIHVWGANKANFDLPAGTRISGGGQAAAIGTASENELGIISTPLTGVPDVPRTGQQMAAGQTGGDSTLARATAPQPRAPEPEPELEPEPPTAVGKSGITVEEAMSRRPAFLEAAKSAQKTAEEAGELGAEKAAEKTAEEVGEKALEDVGETTGKSLLTRGLGAAAGFIEDALPIVGLGADLYTVVSSGMDIAKEIKDDPFGAARTQIQKANQTINTMESNVSADEFQARVGANMPSFGSLAAAGQRAQQQIALHY